MVSSRISGGGGGAGRVLVQARSRDTPQTADLHGLDHAAYDQAVHRPTDAQAKGRLLDAQQQGRDQVLVMC